MKKGNAGYSLVEIVIAMALLAIITIPTYTCLNLSVKVNAAADQLLKAQLAVSSAVETLMAEGIDDTQLAKADDENEYKSRFPTVTISKEETGKYIIASTDQPTVTVTTYIPKMDSTEGEGDG